MGDDRSFKPLPFRGGVGVGPVPTSNTHFQERPDSPTPNPSPEGEGLVTILRFRDDAPHHEPTVTIEAFTGQSNATAVRLEPGDDAYALIPHLGRIAVVEISFPGFRDGRGYSAARILREAGYRGELRAEGDVLVDQIPLMRRCGFDAFAPRAPIDREALARALARQPLVYQTAADGLQPIWKLRHG